jgi:hypothetical protein
MSCFAGRWCWARTRSRSFIIPIAIVVATVVATVVAIIRISCRPLGSTIIIIIIVAIIWV